MEQQKQRNKLRITSPEPLPKCRGGHHLLHLLASNIIMILHLLPNDEKKCDDAEAQLAAAAMVPVTISTENTSTSPKY